MTAAPVERALPEPTSADHLLAIARRAPGGHPDPLLGLTVDDGAWVPVALYPAGTESGGGTLVLISRAPAMFWRIVCERLGVDLSTGSGPDAVHLVDEIAAALAGGMLGPTTEE